MTVSILCHTQRLAQEYKKLTLEDITYKQPVRYESEDQISAAKYFVSLLFIAENSIEFGLGAMADVCFTCYYF